MKFNHKLRSIVLLVLLMSTIKTFAQYESEDDPNDPANFKRHKGFYVGVFLGGYVPNKYTAASYNGYGFDLDGNKNSFVDSWMYQKIHIQYGGEGTLSTQPDQIAVALGVDPGATSPKEWSFDQSDMPDHMKYAAGFLLGINGYYAINKKNGVLLNINFVKLNVTGSFTMGRRKKNSSSTATDSVLTFGIVGSEQRILFQLGYQLMLTNSQKTNFFVEAGVNVNSTHFLKNDIEINNLAINLVDNSNQIQYPTNTYYIRRPNKMGLGVFAGFGVDLVVGKRYTAQIVYDAAYDKINIGPDPKLKLQHAVGVRLYYRL